MGTQLALQNSQLVLALAELESSKRRRCFVKDVASLMQDHIRSRRPLLCQVEAAPVCEGAARAAAESNVQSLTDLESALQCEVVQLDRCVGQLGGQAARMLQKRDCEVEGVLSELNGLPMRFESTTC